MSTDKKVTKKLMQVLQDGKEGYEKAAERVAEAKPDAAAAFRDAASERASMYAELDRIAATYGDDLEEDSGVIAAIHRGWMSLKDALTQDDAAAVVNSAKTGEDYAIEQYEEALNDDVSDEFRPVLQRQLAAIKAARSSLDRFTSAG